MVRYLLPVILLLSAAPAFAQRQPQAAAPMELFSNGYPIGLAGSPLMVAGTLTSVAGVAAITPAPGSSTTSGTANTFATVLAANVNRKDCIVINTGTGNEYVYEGATGSATTAASFPVPAGGSYGCAGVAGVYQGVVSIASSAVSSPYAASEYH